jgi:cobalt-zinc-cadmium efflux system outer membrane protein
VHRHDWRMLLGLFLAAECLAQNPPGAPHAMTWQETESRFRASNPLLLAGKVTIDEARAEEISANLRPNPNLTVGWDQITPFSTAPSRPVAQSFVFSSIDYLHEREHKRELRLESAQKGTSLATAAQADLERNLLFNLRDAFVRVVLAKAVVAVTKENLDDYDKALVVNRDRFQAGAISHVDLQRIELERVRFVADLATATVNLRTAKIDLETLLRDRTPVDEFDVNEPFDFHEPLVTLEELRSQAQASRPDVRQAEQSVEKARTDHRLAVANGSSDPTFGFDIAHQPAPVNDYFGVSVSFPLRIFDRNQGEKARTSLDISRNEKLRDAAQLTAAHDVDSAWATLENTLGLLRPYRDSYLKNAEEVRSTISFSYQHGAASLLDFLDAENEYRSTQLSYLNLIGAYLSAANQVNFAVGREILQ